MKLLPSNPFLQLAETLKVPMAFLLSKDEDGYSKVFEVTQRNKLACLFKLYPTCLHGWCGARGFMETTWEGDQATKCTEALQTLVEFFYNI